MVGTSTENVHCWPDVPRMNGGRHCSCAINPFQPKPYNGKIT